MIDPENAVEVFVVSVVSGAMLIVLAQIFSPEIGQFLLGLLPGFVEWMAYLLVVVLLLAMLTQLFE